MHRNTIDDQTKDLFRFVAFVIHAIFGKDVRNTLLTMDEVGIQQIVPLANQAMIEARSQAQSELMKARWDDPDHVFNSEEFREAISEANKKPSTSIGRQFKKTPGVDDMQPCQFCTQEYHIGQMQRHENGCRKNHNV